MATYDQYRHGYTLRLTVTETATNVETNVSTITYKLQLISGNQYHFEQFGVGAAITMDGTTVASRSRDNDPYLTIGFNSTLTLLSGSTTVAHAADGTKTIALGYSLNMADYYYTPGPMSGTGSFVCATIPRATTPTLSASSVNIGSAVTISVSGRASTSFSHVLTYTIGSTSGTIATLNTSTTSYSWTVPASVANQIPNAKTGTVSITCTTKSGSTTIGAKSVSLSVTVPNTSTYQPSISSFAVTENNSTVAGLNLGSSYLVQGKSNITISGTPSAKYGATIKTTTYTVGSSTVSPSNIPINTSGSITIQMTTTDSRGYSGTSSTTKTSLAYAAPTVSSMTFYRSTSNGTQDGTGTYLHYAFVGAITSLNSKNANTWAIHIQRTGTSTWTQVATGTGYSLNVSGTSSSAILGVDYSYVVRITLTDSFGTSTFTRTVSTGSTTVDYRNTGKGIAFGKASEYDAFECNMPEYLYGDLTVFPGYAIYNNETGMVFGNQSSLPSIPTGDNWGRWIGFTKVTDKYYLYLGSNKIIWLGTDLNGAGSITWTPMAISQATDIGTGDLNNYTNFGCYTQKWSNNATAERHYPVTLAGYLEVIPLSDNAYVLQRYTAYDSSSIWIRDYYNGAWSAWKCVYGARALSTEDLNNITGTGSYYQAQGSRATTANHYPAASAAGFLEVIAAASTFMMQRYTLYDGTKTWVRTYVSGAWTAWTQL